MDNRRKLVWGVMMGGYSLSASCRNAGVTGRKWLRRAEASGIDEMAEMSRAPKRIHNVTSEAKTQALLAAKAQYPEWGARKLSVTLKRDRNIEIPSLTANRSKSKSIGGRESTARGHLAQPM